MREIKFRAWDKKMSIFIPEIESTYEWPNAVCMPERYTLSQFTGLKDKDGKEIYEGDVVRYENAGYDPSEGETPWEIGTVIFNDLAWKVDSGNSYDEFLCDFGMTTLEVIGNIYENPDLLK